MRQTSFLVCAALTLGIGCGSGVSSDEQARRAYLGLDAHVDKAIQLGFDGFNSASSANISPQATTGQASGTLTVTGQVDQGSSPNNKGMRLVEALVKYSDDGKLVYDASASSSTELNMKLSDFLSTSGSLSGTLVKTLTMSGELSGSVTLNLAFTATTHSTSGNLPVVRTPGTTHITGTAVSGNGTFQVDVTR